LPIPDQPGLRPTPDRVRETLFNWLAPVIEGARCLDPFAGTGALGLEAASRGAGPVVLIERSEPVVRQLRDNMRLLRAGGVQVVQADALRWLDDPARSADLGPIDLVFLDPPYAAGLLGPACELLALHHWLSAGARVYLETALASGFPPLPDGWTLIHDRTAGQVRFGLALAGPGGDTADH
jgi:16S rRNA (guanine966-N2)-methyltransferase